MTLELACRISGTCVISTLKSQTYERQESAQYCYSAGCVCFGRGDDTAGNPHRAQISQFELFERVLLSKLDKQFPLELIEAAASQSTVPSPLLMPCVCSTQPIARARGAGKPTANLFCSYRNPRKSPETYGSSLLRTGLAQLVISVSSALPPS